MKYNKSTVPGTVDLLYFSLFHKRIPYSDFWFLTSGFCFFGVSTYL